uniref:Serine protease inhibitor n=1 Tax=Hevea brasiliensis TaxID=3981 RepID=A0A068ERD2_HEVBR|nr:serine protease inhibitor [Hevea brasiliensis]
MASQCPVKDAWPELIGTNGDIAAGIIETENANVKAIVVKEGSPMTMEYNLCRVLVFVDDNRVVTQAPAIG